MTRRSLMRLRHKATNITALGHRRPNGTVLVQFDDMAHRHAHGWRLYPIHHFTRNRGGISVKSKLGVGTATARLMMPRTTPHQIQIGTPEALALAEAWRKQNPAIVQAWADFSAHEQRVQAWAQP